jgi:2,4-dienoyl-CoA reductase (NADPH2)
MALLEPITLGSRVARNRVLFGPHVTNLGDGRAISSRHLAYYVRRMVGGCGIVVTEEASVHPSDWPYERAPLATACCEGWATIASAGRDHGALVVAALGHSGGQGSSAYSQLPLWAPSRVPEVATREVPKSMEREDIAAVVQGFVSASAIVVESGCDGVEVNVGQHSLLRQFLSGLTNQRADEWGADRARLARDVLAGVRAVVGPSRIVGLRLSCDELAPWAGITPEQAPAVAAELVEHVDYLVVTRGSIFSVEQTRPDHHQPPMVNVDVCRAVGVALPDHVAVILQGSVVDWRDADQAIATGVCDAVEMTRAQIADPDLVAKVAEDEHGARGRVRPCLRCNQTCQVRDARNPTVTCVGEPTSGHETEDPSWYERSPSPREVIVIGGGIAGLETARVAARRGHRVRLAERANRFGGVAAITGPGAALAAWLTDECRSLGVRMATGVDALPEHLARVPQAVVVIATGSAPGPYPYAVAEEAAALVHDVLDVRAGRATLPGQGDVVIVDPIGGPIAVALAEDLGERAILVTGDNVAGNELSRTGDLSPANVRLAQKGVRVERRTIVREVWERAGGVEVVAEDRFTGHKRVIDAAVVVDCGFRVPDDALWTATGRHWLRAGDCVAPRTYLEAVLEGRRAAVAIDALAGPPLRHS